MKNFNVKKYHLLGLLLFLSIWRLGYELTKSEKVFYTVVFSYLIVNGYKLLKSKIIVENDKSDK